MSHGIRKKIAANTALIGAGLWGRNIARNLAALGALKGIYDQSHEQAAQIADKCSDTYNVHTLALDDILNDPDIIGVAIATPAPSHHDLAIRALAAGKHIYVEKPLALSLVEAEAIAAAAKQAGKHVMLGHLLRYHAAFIALDAAVRGRPDRSVNPYPRQQISPRPGACYGIRSL